MSSPADIVNQILEKRGLDTDEARADFLNPDYHKVHDARLLPDIKPAIKRLKSAQKQGEPIVIYGDYDVDGLSAASLLSDALTSFGFKTEIFIPDRYKEGYGLNQQALDKLVDGGAKLILTVDTGTTAVKEIKSLKDRGVDVIVTDHHEPPDKLPPAVAVINPKRKDSQYPFKELAGAGVAFKLVQALQTEMPGLDKGQEKWLLDLVALGTVCDVVPLVGENRILAAYGLRVLAQSRRPGLQALAEASGVNLRDATIYHLGFAFGPRLNAAGRLEHANKSLKLLTSKTLDEARPLAYELDGLNTHRQTEQRSIEEQAEAMIAGQAAAQVLVLAHEEWSQGIVGIVAARLLEKHQKPVFVMQILGDSAKGSARSFGGFDLSLALREVKPLLASGGGHKAAAGYSLKTKDIAKFASRLNSYHLSLKLKDQAEHLRVKADMSFNGLKEMTIELADGLSQLAPFGFGNPEPVFELKNLKVSTVKRVGKSQQHAKLVLEDEDKKRVEAIAFNFDGQVKPKDKANVLAKLRRSDFGGWTKPELIIEAINN
ncbi:MAG TPA: single-stranded-DNA-specific exonuclease RecJ [Candidatus Saccharimonadales bacterium]|jgi:single-stranded-DNA-specific exonuclease